MRRKGRRYEGGGGYFIGGDATQFERRGAAGMHALFEISVALVVFLLAMASSVFLGAKLYAIRELCVVCLSTHAINATLWIRTMMEYGNARDKAKIN